MFTVALIRSRARLVSNLSSEKCGAGMRVTGCRFVVRTRVHALMDAIARSRMRAVR